jgi:hypothetical protein
MVLSRFLFSLMPDWIDNMYERDSEEGVTHSL